MVFVEISLPRRLWFRALALSLPNAAWLVPKNDLEVTSQYGSTTIRQLVVSYAEILRHFRARDVKDRQGGITVVVENEVQAGIARQEGFAGNVIEDWKRDRQRWSQCGYMTTPLFNRSGRFIAYVPMGKKQAAFLNVKVKDYNRDNIPVEELKFLSPYQLEAFEFLRQARAESSKSKELAALIKEQLPPVGGVFGVPDSHFSQANIREQMLKFESFRKLATPLLDQAKADR